MKKIFLLTCVLMCLGIISEASALNIFACEPEWKSLAREIAGDKAEIYSATTAFQDVHYIQAKPGLIAKIRKADMVICSGAELEVGWLPVLLQKAGKSSVQEGGINLVYAARYINTLEKPQKVDRANGDVHPDGNPHLHLNPYNLVRVEKAVSDKLAKIDAGNRDFYLENFRHFSDRLQKDIAKWEKKAARLKGVAVVTNHKNMSYLFDWLHIKNTDTLEPKPGIPATSGHLSELVQSVVNNKVKLIAIAPFENPKPAKWLSEKTGVPYVVLPYTVGGNEKATDLFTLFDYSISLLLENINDK